MEDNAKRVTDRFDRHFLETVWKTLFLHIEGSY